MKYIVFSAVILGVLLFRRFIIMKIFTPTKRKIKKIPSNAYENIETKTTKGAIRGWLLKGEGSTTEKKPCFILVHGWGSDKSAMLRYAEPLVAGGYSVICIDVLGHGESDSIQKQVSVETFVDSIKSTIDYAEEHSEIDRNAIFLLGHSMGGLAATIVNATDDRLQGLITDSMPTSLKNISKSMSGKISLPYVPFGWLVVSWFLARGGVFFKTRREWRLEKILMNQQAPALAIHSSLDKKVSISNIDILRNNSNFQQVMKVSTKGHDNCVKDIRFWDVVFQFIASTKATNFMR